MNAAVRTVSDEFHVPFIDSAVAVDAARREAPEAELFDAWAHPMPVVYRQVAHEAFRVLAEQHVVAAVGAAPAVADRE